ncbi:MAG: hypothetical protein HYS53_02595 [Candidatus Aenigmarchaeota archaeon]|nr:hypothetical protein [Candidatus Aenigmarchaeota archaeon]
MAALDFIALQNTLKAMGFYDFVLPWLLAFSIVFGILQTVNVFKKGKEDKPNTSVDAVISLTVAFYLTFFTPYSGFLSSFFSKLFGSSIIVLSGVLVLLMFVGIFGLKSSEFTTGSFKYAVIVIALILAAGLFINANSGAFSFGGADFNPSELLTMLVFFGIIGAVIWFVVHEGKTSTGEEIDPATGKPKK